MVSLLLLAFLGCHTHLSMVCASARALLCHCGSWRPTWTLPNGKRGNWCPRRPARGPPGGGRPHQCSFRTVKVLWVGGGLTHTLAVLPGSSGWRITAAISKSCKVGLTSWSLNNDNNNNKNNSSNNDNYNNTSSNFWIIYCIL